jgi:class 3 adenylate cyclase
LGTSLLWSIRLPTSHQRAVLFVDICDSVQLYETLGDNSAAQQVRACLEALGRLVAEAQGRVVQRIGDELMCLFPSADAALFTAREMQEWTARQALGVQPALAIRIGCHFGPVLESDGDVFGDSVNLAARAAAIARAGQVITTEATVNVLCERLRERVRHLGEFTIKGKAEDVTLCELLWQDADDSTQMGTLPGAPPTATRRARLVLRYPGRELVLDARSRAAIMLGRDAGCDVVIADPKASRRHARIETRRDKFVLIDQSVNGTYVHIGEDEIVLLREELFLYSHGSISFGHRPDASAAAVLEFICQ